MATRLPLIPEHLYSFDSVNLALALEEFEPALHQPQPPGYPLFVGEARIIYWLAGTPERTFTALKILVSFASIALLYLAGSRLFSRAVGLAAAGLLFCNPVFWRAGLTSSLRVHLALATTLVAYFCWRAREGDRPCFYRASVALGLGGGFRPELCLILLPLWLWAGWKLGKRSLGVGALLAAAMVAAWVAPVAGSYGGVGEMISAFRVYALEQSESVAALLGSPAVAWRRMVGRAVLWNGLGVLPWVWTIPLLWRSGKRLAAWRGPLIFLALWFCPGFLFHVTVHIGAAGHALATIPALCLLGGVCITEAQASLAPNRAARGQPMGPVLALALVGSVVLFFWPYALPERKETTRFRGWDSIRDAALVATYETSYAQVQYTERTTSEALRQIADLRSKAKGPVVVMSNRDAVPVWRKVAYYRPSELVYELIGRTTPQPRARLWKGRQMVAEYSGSPTAKLPVPKQGRLIWLVHPDRVGELSESVPVRGRFPALYTDLDEEATNLWWGSFELFPQ